MLTTNRPFGARLAEAIGRHGPLCVGVDPHAELLRAWGLPDDPTGLQHFGDIVLDAVVGRVAIIKPQSAFYERFGSAGIAALERLIARARAAGVLVLLDVKRGDIGSTSAAYAASYLAAGAPLAADAITVNPFLGVDSIRPFLDTAAEHGTGVFILALTSNPDGQQVQHATTADGRSVAALAFDVAAAANADATPLGSVGLVVGATVGFAGLPDRDPARLNGPVLAPGIGEQGAGPEDLPARFGAAVANVLPSASRGLLRHGPDSVALRSAIDTTQRACLESAAVREGAR